MKFIVALIAVTGLAVICSSHKTSTTPCIFYRCSDKYDPVCGKKKVGDCYNVKIFHNNCFMLSENSCGKNNYEPCVENQCRKPTTRPPTRPTTKPC